MKFNQDNIKGILTYCLEKEGFTLQDFEAYLTQQKTAAAKDVMDVGGKALGTLGSLAKLLTFGTLALGGAGGLAGYGAYKQFKDSDNKIEDAYETKRKIDAARRELEALKLQRGY
jgi:hypothetical protein